MKKELTGEVAEDEVAERHGTRIRLECILPVLIDAQPIKASKRSEIRKCDICHITRSPGVCLDKGDIVSLDDTYVSRFL